MDDRGGGRGWFGSAGQRIGVLDGHAVGAGHRVLVAVALTRVNAMALPHPAVAVQRIGSRPPVVPVSDHGHRLGGGGPHREVGTGLPWFASEVGAEAVVEVEVTAGVEQVEIEVGDAVIGDGVIGGFGGFGHGWLTPVRSSRSRTWPRPVTGRSTQSARWLSSYPIS